MKILVTILFLGIMQISFSQNPQEPIYLNFYETFNNYPLDNVNNGSDSCPNYESNTDKYFPDSFFYQIKNTTRIFKTNKDNVPCVGVTSLNGDAICGPVGLDFERSEIGLKDSRLAIHTTGNSYYKLRFFIDSDFLINNYSNDHTIFQIIPSNAGISNSPVKGILPQFLMQVMHEKSTTTNVKLQFNYGLEFNLGGCNGCLLGSNGKADTGNSYYRCGNSTNRKKIEYDINYGWNEILFQVQWSEFTYGWMDIWVNGDHVDSQIGEYYTFVGNNIYNNNMIPYNGGYGDSSKFNNSIKFGSYRYGSNETSTIYFDYFYADNERYNIDNNFETNINNDNVGVLNLREDIKCDEVHNADEFVFLFEDTQTTQQQYLGNPNNTPHILEYDRLLDILDLEFYKDYKVMTRARFLDGFNGKYSNPKTIRLEPDTKLTPEFCGNLNISQSEKLKVEKLKGADGYVLLIQDVNNPANKYYHGVLSTGEIDVSTLFNDLPLLFNREYLINTRARFDQYGMQGSYSTPCTVKFIPTLGNLSTIVYPNPTKGKFFLKSNLNFDQIKIFDISGNIVKKYSKGENLEELNLEEFRKGLYFLVIDGDKQTENFTIIKE